MNNEQEILGLLRQILAAVERRKPLSRANRDALVILIPAIATRCGDYVFTAKELIEYGKTDPAFARALGQHSARKIGKLLRNADGFEQDGLRVVCAGEVREGRLWRVERV